MKRLKPAAVGVLLFFIALTMLSGCNLLNKKDNANDAEALKVSISFFYPRDGSEIIKKLISSYRAEHEDIILETKELSSNGSDYLEKLAAIIAAQEDFPDILMIHDTWVPQFINEGYLKPIDGGFPSNKQAEYFSGMVQAMTYEGKVYGIPFWLDTPLLYYRSDLIPSPPATWEEMQQLALESTVTYKIPYGLIFPADSKENASIFLASLLMAYNAYPDFQAGEAKFDELSMVDAFNRLNNMVNTELIPADVLNMSAEDARTAFEKGNSIFMWNWSYAYSILNNEKSLLYGKIGVIPVPTRHENADIQNILSGWGISMSKQTTKIPEAWSFIEFMTSKEAQSRLALEGGLLPAMNKLYLQQSLTERLGTPSIIYEILNHGRPVGIGIDPDSQLNTMAQVISLSVGSSKDAATLMTYLREGIIIEDAIDNNEEPEDEWVEE